MPMIASAPKHKMCTTLTRVKLTHCAVVSSNSNKLLSLLQKIEVISDRASIFDWKDFAKIIHTTMAKPISSEEESVTVLGKRKATAAWRTNEDEQLKRLVENWDEPKIAWVDVAAHIDGRTAKQCRERWMNQLRPNLKKGDWTDEEDQLIHSLQRKLGNKWSKIAEFLPHRTDNDIKNRWHSFKRQQLRRYSGKCRKTRTTEHGLIAETAESLREKKYPKAQLTPGYTPIRHDDIESILLENAALSLSSMKSKEMDNVHTEGCGKENSPANGISQQGFVASGCKTRSVSQERNSKNDWVSADFASPSKFRWNNVTPCSSRTLRSLPLCESGPFINSQFSTERSNLNSQNNSQVMILKRNHSTPKTDRPRAAPDLTSPLHPSNFPNTERNLKVMSSGDDLTINRERGGPISNSYPRDQHDKKNILLVHPNIQKEQLDKMLLIRGNSQSAKLDNVTTSFEFPNSHAESNQDRQQRQSRMSPVYLDTNHQQDGNLWFIPNSSQSALNNSGITPTQQIIKEDHNLKPILASDMSRVAGYEEEVTYAHQSTKEEHFVLTPTSNSSQSSQNDTVLTRELTAINEEADYNDDTSAISRNQTHGASTSEE